MRTFSYRGYDAEGRPQRGLIEAETPKQARAALAEAGTLAEVVEPVGQRGKPVGSARRCSVYRELGALLDAGMPVDRALGLLIETEELRGAHAFLAGVRDRIREGAALAEALQAECPGASVFELSALRAGERAGALGDVLNELAEVEEERLAVTERLRSALIYPGFVAILGLLIAGGMLGFLVPRAAAVLVETQGELPGLTRAMAGVGRWALRGGLLLLASLGVGGWLLWRRALNDPRQRAQWEQRGRRLPFIGRSLGLLWSFRFAKTLAMLIRAGVPLVEGVGLAGRATGAAWVAQLAEVAAEGVQQGQALSAALRPMCVAVSPALAEWSRVGESSGKLPQMLEHAAQRCRASWETALTRVMALVEPFLIVLIGGFVLIVALSVLLPVLSMTRQIGG